MAVFTGGILTVVTVAFLCTPAWTQIIAPLRPNELSVDQRVPACPLLNPFAYMRDHNNCGMFYRCFWGKAVPMSGCTPGLVFSNILNICVHQGTIWDDCTVPGVVTDPKYLTPQQRCKQGDFVFPHPDNCAMFYNCSLGYSPRPRFGKQHLDECRYPQLFDSNRLQCADFTTVKCGTRNEPKAGCDYKRNQCQRAHCRPCWLSYPSCINVTDGLHFDDKRPWTPYYVECKSERSMELRQCQARNGVQQIFSPDLLQCISIYDVPRQYNGLRPDCNGKQNRLYPEENGRCNIYIQCTNQQYAGYGKCPSGLNFDEATQSCKLPSEMCPPCGNNTNACAL